jgi:hypothetical protein
LVKDKKFAVVETKLDGFVKKDNTLTKELTSQRSKENNSVTEEVKQGSDGNESDSSLSNYDKRLPGEKSIGKSKSKSSKKAGKANKGPSMRSDSSIKGLEMPVPELDERAVFVPMSNRRECKMTIVKRVTED